MRTYVKFQISKNKLQVNYSLQISGSETIHTQARKPIDQIFTVDFFEDR